MLAVKRRIGAAYIVAAATIVTGHLYEGTAISDELVLPPSVSNAAKLDAWLLHYCLENLTTAVDAGHVL